MIFGVAWLLAEHVSEQGGPGFYPRWGGLGANVWHLHLLPSCSV